MKIHQEPKETDIPLSELQYGQIAVITRWSSASCYIGRIVQRAGHLLVEIGGGNNDHWNWEQLKHHVDFVDGMRVRVLKPGTLLEI